MKKIAFILLLLVTGTLYAQVKQVNDPNAQVRNVSGFHSIKVSHAIDLYLSQSANEVVAVSAAKDEYREKIKTEVNNGVLRIWYDSKNMWEKGNKKLKAYVSFKTLQMLNVSGACDVRVTGKIEAQNLSVDMSGASDFNGTIQANTLKVSLSGASDMMVNGKVGNLTVDASGASDFKGYDLETENCEADASGASDIRVTVNKELKADASGASGVYYKGNGVIRDVKSSGASSIKKS